MNGEKSLPRLGLIAAVRATEGGIRYLGLRIVNNVEECLLRNSKSSIVISADDVLINGDLPI